MQRFFVQLQPCHGAGQVAHFGIEALFDATKLALGRYLARQRGLLASRASDFHGVQESMVDVGRCNPLPADLEPVWSRLPATAAALAAAASSVR